MIRKKIISIGFASVLTLLGIAYLLWPLDSDQFQIRHDPALVGAKEAYLSQLASDSLDSADQPNVVIIMADDLGLTDISLFGSSLVNTHHIDQLAGQGTVFTQAYVTSPVCSPSRAGFLTGRYQQRFGFENQMQERYLRNRLEYYGMKFFVDSSPWSIHDMAAVPAPDEICHQGLPPTEITIAEILKARGYATALIGKWHLGRIPGSLPCDFGFDYHYGFYGSHSLYAPESQEGMVDQKISGDWTDPYIWAGQRNGSHAMNRNCQPIEESDYLTTKFAQESIEFIQRNRAKPFFLFASFSAPHTPLQVPQEYYDDFAHIEDPYKRAYNAMIAALDDGVGKITDELERLGLSENTLVFFLSDNGGATYTLTTDNAPYKGGKITSFEGGLRVPFILRWPKKVTPGKWYNKAISSLDVFATICAATGSELPSGRDYDGVDLMPFITTPSVGNPHPVLYWKRGAVRTIRSENWKLVFDDKYNQSLLYDLATDSLETTNLAGRQPAIVRQLKQQHAFWSASFPKPLWPPLVTFEYAQDGEVYYFDN